MKLLFLLLPLGLCSCGVSGKQDPIDWATLTLWFWALLVVYAVSKAGYYQGLAEGRDDHLDDLAEEVMHGREKLAESRISTGMLSAGNFSHAAELKPSVFGPDALRIAEIMHDEYHLATGDTIRGVLLWEAKIRDPECLKECNAFRHAAQRVCDAFALAQS